MNKGFTLIELLSVIIILAIILVVAVPRIMKAIDSSKVNAYISNEKLVLKSAELYVSKNIDTLPVNIGDTSEILLSDLITDGYIQDIKSPFNKNNSCSGYVLITKVSNDKYDYIPHINCIDNTVVSSLEDKLILHHKYDDVEEGTTNLWVEGLTAYNNLSIPATLVATGEKYMDANVYRLTMTPTTQAQVDSIKSNLWNHGVVGSNITYLGSTKYTSSIYWKPINKTDVQVDGLASNIGGWASGINEVLGGGWTRCISHRNGTVVDPKTGHIFWSFRSPSFVLGDTMIIDWAAPQIEQKEYATSYTATTRDTIIEDYSIQDNFGTAYNTTITSDRFNKEKNAMHFNGTSSYIMSNNSATLNIIDKLTISMWIYPTLFDRQTVIERTNVGGTGGSYTIYSSGNSTTDAGRPEVHMKKSSAWLQVIKANSTIELNKWSNLSVTWDGTTAKLFINGILDKTASFVGPLEIVDSTLAIGYSPWNSSYYFKGSIDDMKIYNRSLSDSEIKLLYDTAK